MRLPEQDVRVWHEDVSQRHWQAIERAQALCTRSESMRAYAQKALQAVRAQPHPVFVQAQDGGLHIKILGRRS